MGKLVWRNLLEMLAALILVVALFHFVIQPWLRGTLQDDLTVMRADSTLADSTIVQHVRDSMNVLIKSADSAAMVARDSAQHLAQKDSLDRATHSALATRTTMLADSVRRLGGTAKDWEALYDRRTSDFDAVLGELDTKVEIINQMRRRADADSLHLAVLNSRIALDSVRLDTLTKTLIIVKTQLAHRRTGLARFLPKVTVGYGATLHRDDTGAIHLITGPTASAGYTIPLPH